MFIGVGMEICMPMGTHHVMNMGMSGSMEGASLSQLGDYFPRGLA